MKIATVLNVHGNTELVLDTVDAIRTWVGPDVLLLVDGAAWGWAESLQVQAHKLKGFYHGVPKSPYRNVTLGLYNAIQKWPSYDWICYCEYDVLFASSDFKQDLSKAQHSKVWCLGNDYRSGALKFPFLESMMKMKFPESKYLLGCCIFHQGDFLRTLLKINFFDKFLSWTNAFSGGYFPGYEEQGGYAFEEHLYPTLAHHLGGRVEQFASWNASQCQWRGNYKRYPMRWKPDLDPHQENFPEASIMHPIKSMDHPVRHWQQTKRQACKKGSRNNEPTRLQSHNFGVRGGCFLKLLHAPERRANQVAPQDARR